MLKVIQVQQVTLGRKVILELQGHKGLKVSGLIKGHKVLLV